MPGSMIYHLSCYFNSSKGVTSGLAVCPERLSLLMFISCLISLRPFNARSFGISEARFVHAAVLQAIGEVDPEASAQLHRPGRDKLFSCAILPTGDTNIRLRVTFHSPIGIRLQTLLLSALGRKPVLRLGSVECEVFDVQISPSQWSGVASWADLLEGPTGNRITLNFETPTAIMRQDGLGHRYSLLFPDPTAVFLGLHRRWRSLDGPSVLLDLEPNLRDAACVIARYQLRTESFRTAERVQIGFVGSVMYECRQANEVFARSLCALARLAHYTGVGYQTTRGMGLVQAHIGR